MRMLWGGVTPSEIGDVTGIILNIFEVEVEFREVGSGNNYESHN